MITKVAFIPILPHSFKKRHVWLAKTLVGSDFNNLRSGEISADLL